MRALLSEAAGGPETLRVAELPDPEPGPGEVRVAVAACGINFPDALIIEDRYQYRPERPFAPGCEMAGTIDALGEGVSDLKVGDRVLGGNVCGGLATRFVLPAERCYVVPPSMPFDVAASFLMTYGTSHYALKERGALKHGETLLVLGAAGGVGLAAVEIGKFMGAKVIAAVSSEGKAEVARAHGADAAIVYPAEALDRDAARAFSAQIKAAAGGEIDMVYDPVGGSYAEPALRTMAWEGRYLVIGFAAGIPTVPLNLALLKGCQIVGVFWGAFAERDMVANRANVHELMRWYEEGAFDPLISERYPLERGGEAIAALSARKALGKLVVMVGEGGDR